MGTIIRMSDQRRLQAIVYLAIVSVTVAVPQRFIDFPEDGILVPDTAPIGAVVATIKATDDDGDELTISFPYQNARSVVHVQCCSMTGSENEITTANITLNMKLDATEKTDYGNIQFKVSQGNYGISKTTKILSEVGELPKFVGGKDQYSATIPLNAAIGHNITTVQATSKYPPVSYNFKERSSFFEISEDGIVTLNNELTNITVGDVELLTIMAKDRYGAYVEGSLSIYVEEEAVEDKTTDNSSGWTFKSLSFHMICQLMISTLVSKLTLLFCFRPS
ncbi:unnamed protein product [Owenia fusiformis]|uniref:Uncharacterized protein n=1 Tax=Owenia fusiformis TaxID=6347 RepID=A0A8J1TG63_OWEFU|nr:unnamed protein product [Owenia fusiformis]